MSEAENALDGASKEGNKDWRNGSAIKNTCFSIVRTEFRFQYPHQAAHKYL